MLRLFFTFFSICFFCSNVFALETRNEKIPNSYFRDSYGVDNNFSSFKAYGLWSLIKNEETSFPEIPKDATGNPILSQPKSNTELFQYGYGVGASFTTYFNNNVGVELGLSGLVYQVNKDQLSNVQYNYTNRDSNTPATPVIPSGAKAGDAISDDSVIYSVPVHAIIQFCIAPSGGIRPYVGGGYHINYVYSPFKEFDVAFMHGPVAQAGVDFIGKDDTIYTIEVKKYFVNETKINYKSGFIYKEFSTNTNFSPLIISAGIGFKF